MRYFNGQEWKGRGRFTALDDFGPLPRTEESRRQATVAELMQQQGQIEQALTSGTAAMAEMAQERSVLEAQITELRKAKVEVEQQSYLVSVNMRDFFKTASPRHWNTTDEQQMLAAVTA